MSIFYDANQRTFTLSGGDVSYVLHIDDCGRVMNLYWGSRLPDGDLGYLMTGYWGGASFDSPASHAAASSMDSTQ